MNEISNVDINIDIDKFSPEIPLPTIAAIRNHLKKNGQSIRWLAQKLQLDSKYLTNVLNEIYPLTEKNRQKINEVFGTDF